MVNDQRRLREEAERQLEKRADVLQRDIDTEKMRVAEQFDNYAKILETQKNTPSKYYPFFMEQLMETVRQKVGASIERSYEKLSTAEATKMLILNNVEELKEFAAKENDRKARESEDDLMLGDTTPSFGRRPNVGLIQWEVADGNLKFKRSAEKQLEIPALELMVNTIGYATDLERIV